MARKKSDSCVDVLEDVLLAKMVPKTSWKMPPLEAKLASQIARSAPEVSRRRFLGRFVRPATGRYFAMWHYGGVPRSDTRQRLAAIKKAATPLLVALRALDDQEAESLFRRVDYARIVECIEMESETAIQVLSGTKQDAARSLRVYIQTLRDGWTNSGGPRPTFTQIDNEPESSDGNPFCEVVRLIFDHLREIRPEPGDDIVPTHLNPERVRLRTRPGIPGSGAVEYALKSALKT